MLVPVDGKELVEADIFLKLFTNRSQFQTKIEVMMFYDFNFLFLGAEGFFLNCWSKEFSWVHVSFQQEASQLLQNFGGLFVKNIKLEHDRILLGILWFLGKFL
jgi:hypothetical protein